MVNRYNRNTRVYLEFHVGDRGQAGAKDWVKRKDLAPYEQLETSPLGELKKDLGDRKFYGWIKVRAPLRSPVDSSAE